MTAITSKSLDDLARHGGEHGFGIKTANPKDLRRVKDAWDIPSKAKEMCNCLVLQ